MMRRPRRLRTIAPLAVLGAVTAMSGNAAAESLNTTATISRVAPQVRLGASIRPISVRLPGCTIYVSSTGRDASSGRDQRHPTSLLQATRIVQPGSVVAAPGTYLTSDRIMLLRSGRPGAPITYRNYGGTALLQYVGGPLGGGVLQTDSGANWGGSHDIVIDGLTINGANLIDGGVFVTQGSHNVTIRNCVITNTGSTGIAVQASDYVTITHNQIFHFGYHRGWSGGSRSGVAATTPSTVAGRPGTTGLRASTRSSSTMSWAVASMDRDDTPTVTGLSSTARDRSHPS